MMMTDSAGRARFGELVKLQTQGRRFLDRDQERKLLEEGITRYGLTLDEAQRVLRGTAQEGDVAMEAELGASSRQLLRTLADRRSRVAKDDFARAVAFYRARAGGEMTEAEARRRVKRLMEELDLQPRPSGRILRSRRWYRVIDA
jgi:transcription initiation factor TFIIIB Brf1 subunit/transcription initiation factor TFIIB